jgi:hypothetical protein
LTIHVRQSKRRQFRFWGKFLRRWWFLIFCGVLLAIGYCLRSIAPSASPDVIQYSRSILLPNTVGVFPEPQDPFMFVSMTVASGLALFGLAVFAARTGRVPIEAGAVFWPVAAIGLAVVIYENAFRNIRIVAIGAAGLLVAFLLSKVPSRLRERAACFCLAAILPVFALLILLQRVWDEGSLVYGGPISSHYEAVTSSVVRISAGSTCLAEVLPQYGCYGEFLAPLLKLFGGTVPVVTALFRCSSSWRCGRP